MQVGGGWGPGVAVEVAVVSCRVRDSGHAASGKKIEQWAVPRWC